MEYNVENYKKGLAEIDKEKEVKIRRLNIEFAQANNPYKQNDIVQDHIGRLLVHEIKYRGRGWNDLPECLYYGVELKKDGSPMKKQSGRCVYQSNILKDE